MGGLRAFLRLADAATPRAAKGIGNAKTKLDFADVRIYKDEFIKPCAIYNKIFISPPLSSNIIFTLTLNKPSKQNEFDEFHQKPQQISQNSYIF